ncbi:MAG: dipeptide epimerase, partial [Saprospiraceae bacterium]|nr:dipeptide epimerase [Saprospiraceae bacterium]
MKITNVHVWRADLGLRRPYTITGQTVDTSENIFIVIETDRGIQGIGSASPSERVSNESLDDCEQALRAIGGALQGEDLRHFHAVCSRIMYRVDATPAAVGAADMALYDAFCKIHEVRVVDYLGAVHKALPTSVTIGIKELDAVRDDLLRYLKQGFTCIKVKIGLDLEHDLEVLHRMREWGGKAFRIRVDANQGYDPGRLQAFYKRTAALDIELIEQPFAVPGAEQMRAVTPEIRRMCMADEDLQTVRDAVALLQEPLPYGLWNIKLNKSGGVTGSKLLADLAALRIIPLMWGCADESRVSISAALHVAYACANTRYLDLDGSFDLAR